MKKGIILTAFLTIFTLFGAVGLALAGDPIYTGTFSNDAIRGYDTVSYFTGDGAPVKGLDQFQTDWRGADWLFSSQENLDKFKTNPEKYAPQYGGHCAWATAHGTLAKGSPKVYALENGKLYLNYDKRIQTSWLPRRVELIPVADVKYPRLVDLN